MLLFFFLFQTFDSILFTKYIKAKILGYTIYSIWLIFYRGTGELEEEEEEEGEEEEEERRRRRRQRRAKHATATRMPPTIGETLRVWFLSALVVHGAVAGNPDAKRLYDDLLSNYNKLVRPVVNTSDVLRVCIKLKLSQLIDVVSFFYLIYVRKIYLFYIYCTIIILFVDWFIESYNFYLKIYVYTFCFF